NLPRQAGAIFSYPPKPPSAPGSVRKKNYARTTDLGERAGSGSQQIVGQPHRPLATATVALQICKARLHEVATASFFAHPAIGEWLHISGRFDVDEHIRDARVTLLDRG